MTTHLYTPTDTRDFPCYSMTSDGQKFQTALKSFIGHRMGVPAMVYRAAKRNQNARQCKGFARHSCMHI
jgi:hypothetical protein